MKSAALIVVLFCTPIVACGANREASPQSPIAARAAEVYSGDFKVRVGSYRGSWEENGQPRKPWSGWWYPYYQDLMFKARKGEAAPLERLDEYMRRTRGRLDKSAVAYERDELFSRHEGAGELWVGHCLGWAFASILYPEPTTTITAQGVPFRVVDQKALMIKSVENVLVRTKGKPDKGIIQVGSVFVDHTTRGDDIFAADFFRVLIEELGNKHRPFVMDYDADRAKWNVPVYQFEGELTRVNDRTLKGQLKVTFADSQLQVVKDYDDAPSEIPDHQGTKDGIKLYFFELYGSFGSDGLFNVSGSEWIQDGVFDSYRDHPDYVMLFPDNSSELTSRTQNLNIDLAAVDEILKKGTPGNSATGSISSPSSSPASGEAGRTKSREKKRNR